MRIHKITNICILLLSLTILVQASIVSFAAENNNEGALTSKRSAVNKKLTVDYDTVKAEADNLFYNGISSKNEKIKEAYLSQSLKKYMLLLSNNSKDIYVCTQVGVIHDNLGHAILAKEYLYRAININPYDPYANFYYGEYFFAKRDYQNALIYYKKAYDHGYSQYFEVNFRIGTIYEKLGDIEKAKRYYRAAKIRNPYLKGMYAKIKSLDNVYYSKSDYQK